MLYEAVDFLLIIRSNSTPTCFGNQMPKHAGVELERINNKKSTTSYSICWSSYIRCYKMVGSTIKIYYRGYYI
jgi:hypothetical protein